MKNKSIHYTISQIEKVIKRAKREGDDIGNAVRNYNGIIVDNNGMYRLAKNIKTT